MTPGAQSKYAQQSFQQPFNSTGGGYAGGKASQLPQGQQHGHPQVRVNYTSSLPSDMPW